nr:uncharacterized protein LOC109151979 [Ipomoea trifida]
MTLENFVQPAIPRFGGYYDHYWSMLMENFLRSKELWCVIETAVVEPTSSLMIHEQKFIHQENEEQALKISTENHPSLRGNRGRGRGRRERRGGHNNIYLDNPKTERLVKG